MKVIIGMSGGVDSTIAAYLLKKNGYEVIGATMDIGSDIFDIKKDIEDAKKVCDKLDIEHVVVDVKSNFKKLIIDRFVNDYINGLTPPPCSLCNGKIKFKMLYDKKEELKFDKIATGHYANVGFENNRYFIKKSKNMNKDQSYMLYNLTQEELSNLIFPIGDMDKNDIRLIAKDLSLEVSDKKDSEDLCFIKNINYKKFIIKYFLGEDYEYKLAKGELTEKDIIAKCGFLKTGQYIDKNGKVLGYHNGVINYTIGQRKGLNIAFGERKFVIDINSDNNQVILGDNSDLYNNIIELKVNEDLVFQKLEKIDKEIDCTVKVRYRDNYHKCKINMENGKIVIKCEDDIRAITKGQVAVLFDNDDILMGGIIC